MLSTSRNLHSKFKRFINLARNKMHPKLNILVTNHVYTLIFFLLVACTLFTVLVEVTCVSERDCSSWVLEFLNELVIASTFCRLSLLSFSAFRCIGSLAHNIYVIQSNYTLILVFQGGPISLRALQMKCATAAIISHLEYAMCLCGESTPDLAVPQ